MYTTIQVRWGQYATPLLQIMNTLDDAIVKTTVNSIYLVDFSRNLCVDRQMDVEGLQDVSMADNTTRLVDQATETDPESGVDMQQLS